ncbi:MAG: FAD-linked oxidase C-terminal domain-containing protein, partial [Dehalococcoidia bacterium]|nr:FAD-linked oxidase C-terminal domain-containing protein [Dehalococcoidia bacterium]
NGIPEFLREARSLAVTMGGYLVLEEATPEIKTAVGVGVDTGASSPVFRRIKAIFDPKGVMNPGVFVGGV